MIRLIQLSLGRIKMCIINYCRRKNASNNFRRTPSDDRMKGTKIRQFDHKNFQNHVIFSFLLLSLTTSFSCKSLTKSVKVVNLILDRRPNHAAKITLVDYILTSRIGRTADVVD